VFVMTWRSRPGKVKRKGPKRKKGWGRRNKNGERPKSVVLGIKKKDPQQPVRKKE